MTNNLFITGRIRSGKSTLLKSMVDPIIALTGGYFVQRLFIRGETKGFRLVDITQESYQPDRQMQDLEDFSGLIAVLGEGGKNCCYETFHTMGVSILNQASREKQLILMDELGRIETKVPEFTQAVFQVLDSTIPVLGVIKKETNPFLDRIRARPDVQVIDLDDWGLDRAENGIRQFLKARFPYYLDIGK